MKDKYFRDVDNLALRAWQQVKVMVDFKTECDFEGYKEYASQLTDAELTNCKIMCLRIKEKGVAFVENEVLDLVEAENV